MTEYRKFLDIRGDNILMFLTFGGQFPLLDLFRWARVELDEKSEIFSEFTEICRISPERIIYPNATLDDLRFWSEHPRYRLDGSKIEDNLEYSIALITEAIIKELHRILLEKLAGTINDNGVFIRNSAVIEYGIPIQIKNSKDGFAIDGDFLFISTEMDNLSIRHKASMWIRPVFFEAV